MSVADEEVIGFLVRAVFFFGLGTLLVLFAYFSIMTVLGISPETPIPWLLKKLDWVADRF